MKKRLISLTMILALFITMSLPSFASNGTYSIDEIDGGNVFSSVSAQETIVILSIDISSQFIEYPQGREYYYSFSSQIADAYIMFERVGQKP